MRTRDQRFRWCTMEPTPPELTPAEHAKFGHERRSYDLSRASLVVSIFALITSIVSPFISYYWLQGSLRLYELKKSSFVAEGEIGRSPTNCEGIPDTGRPIYADYGVSLHNDGSLPIEKVRVLIDKSFIKERRFIKFLNLDPKFIKAIPPAPFDVENNERGIDITFKDALPPHSSIILTLTDYMRLAKNANLQNSAPDVWVFSEVSGKSILWSDAYVWEYDCP
jgi:hypothetical protein